MLIEYAQCFEMVTCGMWHLKWLNLVCGTVLKVMSKGKEQARKAQRVSIVIAVLFFNFDTRWEWVVNATPRSLTLPGKDSVPIV
jgi:hypothetical protein